ncbi:hypothetical protein DYB32_009653, partial [Aphanomyces invadans]
IANAIDALAALEERRLAKRERYSIESNDATAEDLDSASPVTGQYIAVKGVEVVHTLTNFTVSELITLWTNIKPYVSKNWNVGGGRKCPVTGKDMLFMTLVTLKHGGTWDMLVASFDEKAATFSNRCIDEQGIKWTMHQLAVAGLQFETHKSALYAVDVTFQQTTTPAVSFNKKTYFSKKHGLYGHKVELPVGPNCLAINVADCAVGSTSDFEMFKANLRFHSKHLEKQPNDNNVSDSDALRDSFAINGPFLRIRATKASKITSVVLLQSSAHHTDN